MMDIVITGTVTDVAEVSRERLAEALGAGDIAHQFKCGEMLMTERERRSLLRDMLARVNAEWRDLSRASGTEAKLSRMKELRSARLTITSEIFKLDRQDRRAS